MDCDQRRLSTGAMRGNEYLTSMDQFDYFLNYILKTSLTFNLIYLLYLTNGVNEQKNYYIRRSPRSKSLI